MSRKLWMGQERSFPVIPLMEGLTPIADIASFVFSLALLLLIALLFRKNLSLFLLLAFIFTFLVVIDLDRLQPWLFQLMFLIWALSWRSTEGAYKGVLCILSFTYIISGIQKFNPFFGAEVVPSLMEMGGLQPKDWMGLSRILIYFIPAYELLAGLGLIFQFSRRLSLLAIALMHTLILIISHENNVIIPWNISLALIALILYIKPFKGNLMAVLKKRESAIGMYIIILFFGVLPLLGLIGYWPYNLSAAMYSGLKPECVYYSKEADLNKVLPDWDTDIIEHNEQEGIYFVDMDAWALKELNVPTAGGERLMRAIARKICRKTKTGHAGGIYFTTKSRWHYGPDTRKCNCDSLLKLH